MPLLSTFGGGSIRGFNPGGPVGGEAVASDVFPYFTVDGSNAPISNLANVTLLNHGRSGNFGGIIMEPGGNRLWLYNYGATDVHEFNLSTPYMIAGMSHSSTSTWSTLDTTFAIDPSGTYVLSGDRGSATVSELSVPWEINGNKTTVQTGLVGGHWGSFGDANTAPNPFTVGIYSRSSDDFTVYEGSAPTNTLSSQKSGWQPDGSGQINSYGGHVSPDGKAMVLHSFTNTDFHFHSFGQLGADPWNAQSLQDRVTVNYSTSGLSGGSIMGLQLVRVGGGTGAGSQGYAYYCDSYNTSNLRQISFTWQV